MLQTSVNRMVSLIEVVHGHADVLVECIDVSFQEFGLPSWREKTVGFCADGASVNLGQEAGVVAIIKQDIPHFIDIHCMAHWLELALFQVQKTSRW